MDNKDVQGVPRGKCMQPGCSCPGYFGGEKKLKCERCSHPPVKHENLRSASPLTSYSGVPDSGSGPQTYARVTAQPPPNPLAYPMSDSGRSHYHGGERQFQLQSSDTSSNWLPKCKHPTCRRSVHCEPDVGLFDYCSPECRDKDMLEKDKSKLKRDLERLAKDLRASPKGSTTSTHSPKGSNVRSPKGTATRQLTRLVYSQKPADCEFGMIVYHEVYTLEHIRGFLVTGVEVQSKAYEMLKKKELRLLDVITRVNNTPVESLSQPVDVELKRSKAADFELNCTIGIECSSSLFTNVEKLKATRAHIIVLMNPNQFRHAEFGFDVDSVPGQASLKVIFVAEGKVARRSGLKYGDSILSYAMATKESTETLRPCPKSPDLLNSKMREASKDGKHVMLVINRRGRHH